MNLEELNKSQLILLTLLTSFVTSIATGIVTVSLMEEAPQTIAQTVNRVVERTVERVVPSGQPANAAATVVTEKTVIVKESDQIAGAIDTASPSVVRLFTEGLDETGKPRDVFLGLGFVLSADGVIITDVATIPAGTITVEVKDGGRALATLEKSDPVTGLAVLRGATSTGETPIEWKPARMAGKERSLGDVVISISGKSSIRIGNGIITALSGDDTSVVETNVPVGAVAYGSAFINTDGEIEGLSTAASRLTGENAFLASESILMYTAPQEAPDAATGA